MYSFIGIFLESMVLLIYFKFLADPSGLKGGFTASRSCECCVLSGRCLCDGPITRPEEFYRLGCVIVCDLETSRISWPCPRWAVAPKENRILVLGC
jgi:hypothetical protein